MRFRYRFPMDRFWPPLSRAVLGSYDSTRGSVCQVEHRLGRVSAPSVGRKGLRPAESSNDRRLEAETCSTLSGSLGVNPIASALIKYFTANLQHPQRVVGR